MDPAQTSPGPPRPSGAEPSEPADAVRTCPNCGRGLAERSCRLLCPDPRCGYYLSCSDFY